MNFPHSILPSFQNFTAIRISVKDSFVPKAWDVVASHHFFANIITRKKNISK